MTRPTVRAFEGQIVERTPDNGGRAPTRVAVNLSPATLATDFDHLVETVLADSACPHPI